MGSDLHHAERHSHNSTTQLDCRPRRCRSTGVDTQSECLYSYGRASDGLPPDQEAKRMSIPQACYETPVSLPPSHRRGFVMRAFRQPA
jgi:hypothetical protein